MMSPCFILQTIALFIYCASAVQCPEDFQKPNALRNTEFHHTAGVSVDVTAFPKPVNSTSLAPFTFNDSGTVTLPQHGIYYMTFEFTIPVG